MIVSHRNRFIFLKTKKVGGSSLEMALSGLCGPDDILTPIGYGAEERRAVLGLPNAQNWAKPLWQRSKGELIRRILYGTVPPRFTNHMAAGDLRAQVGAEVWDSYFKFTVVRNPWDYVVSLFFFFRNAQRTKLAGRDALTTPRTGDPGAQEQFADDHGEAHEVQAEFRNALLKHPERILFNQNIYMIGDEVAVDFVVRYEALEQDLAEVSRRLGFDHNLFDDMQRFTEKAEFRPRRFTTARMFEGFDEGIELVRILAADDIRLGGYSPPVID